MTDPESFMVLLVDGEDVVAFAWRLSQFDGWTVELPDGKRVTVDTREGMERVLSLISALWLRTSEPSWERDDPETGEPVPPWVEGFPLGRAALASASR